MPRALQPENCFVIFMWRAAFVCQTSRLILWEQAEAVMPAATMHRAFTAPCWRVFSIVQFTLPRTKWLRIDCSNLFIPRWGGSVSRPKITLKSDYIQFRTPRNEQFSPDFQPGAVRLRACARVHMRMCCCTRAALVYIFFFCLCVFQKEKLQGCMELLGDILSYHESSLADAPTSSLVHHRMAYAGTAVLTIKLLQTVLPTEKVCLC